MAGYWWECDTCDYGHNRINNFKEVCNHISIYYFLWDDIYVNGWNQDKLVHLCRNCNNGRLHITYNFPKKDEDIYRVLHIVGLDPWQGTWLPMMWETNEIKDIYKISYFDFKYLSKGRGGTWGLNKAAIFSQQQLVQVFGLYSDKVFQDKENKTLFPYKLI